MLTDPVKAILGNAATVITIVAYIPYILSILKGKTKPSKVTWFVISVIGLVNFLFYREIGADNTLGIALVNVFGPFIILMLCIIRDGFSNNKGDLKYLIISAVAIILWATTGLPGPALAFNLVADFAGFFPTIKKSFLFPRTEDLLTWFLFFIGGVVAMLSLEEFTFGLIIYPLYIIIAEGAVFFILGVNKLKFFLNLRI